MKILLTAGGTEEPIDSVRKITNMSTGKLGAEICNALINTWDEEGTLEDHQIFYVCNKNSIKPNPSSSVTIIQTTDVKSVEWAIGSISGTNQIDCFVHSMAVSDYTVDGAFFEEKSNNETFFKKIDTSKKMKSNHDEIYLKLVKTPKIVDEIKIENPHAKLISFKLLNDVSDEELIKVAKAQLERTNSSLVVANDLANIKRGNHRAVIVDNQNSTVIEGKTNIANFLQDYINHV